MQDIAQADHRPDGLILRHALEEGVPILWPLPQVTDAFRHVNQRAIDVEDDDLFTHAFHLLVADRVVVRLSSPAGPDSQAGVMSDSERGQNESEILRVLTKEHTYSLFALTSSTRIQPR